MTIAKAELKTFFYSPVAWLILVIFTLQCAAAWSGTIDELAREAAMNGRLPSLTAWVLTRTTWGTGVLTAAARYLYIFYPLLTMGLISRELANGSIKLLDSSPLTAWQIAVGKFAGMMVYSCLLLVILMIFTAAAAMMVPGFNWGLALTAMLGVGLTMTFYSAVGLFASSLTRYPVAAAIASLALFMALERVGEFGQQWPGVRGAAAWLSTSGRAQAFADGLLSSRHVFYYLVMSAMFFIFTVLRLQLSHSQMGLWRRLARYGTVAAAAVAVGWLTSRPALRFYADATETDLNTIMPASREAVQRLRGRLTVTTYVNLMDKYVAAGLPRNITADRAQFEKWQRFHPDMRFEYVYYYNGATEPAREMARLTKTPFRIFKQAAEVSSPVDLAAEKFQFFRVLSLPDGRFSVLRMFDQTPSWPDEEEIATAFRRLTEPAPRVGFAAGHGERSICDVSPRGYNRFAADRFNRFSLLSQGLEPVEVALNEVPDVDILVIADPRTPYSDTELASLDAFIAHGGDLVLLVEPDSHPVTAPLLQRLGVELEPGRLAQAPVMELADVVGTSPSPQAAELLDMGWMKYPFREVAMPGAGALRVSGSGSDSGSGGWLPLLLTRPDAWNKIGSVDWIQGNVQPVAARGERVWQFAPALMLVRGGQKIVVAADADWLDNNEVRIGRGGFTSRPGNMAYYLFGWLTDGAAPMRLHRPEPTDNIFVLSQHHARLLKIASLWLLPALLVLLAAIILIRRNRK